MGKRKHQKFKNKLDKLDGVSYSERGGKYNFNYSRVAVRRR